MQSESIYGHRTYKLSSTIMSLLFLRRLTPVDRTLTQLHFNLDNWCTVDKNVRTTCEYISGGDFSYRLRFIDAVYSVETSGINNTTESCNP